MRIPIKSLLLLLLLSGKVLGQTSFNRWEARPPATETPAVKLPVKRKVAYTKAQQDSLRIVANAAKLPLLQRGLGQRIKENALLPADAPYQTYISSTIRYPTTEALRAGTEGQVILRLVVDAAGNVVKTVLLGSTIPAGAVGREVMVQQVEALLRQLRFEPADAETTEEMELGYHIM